MPVQDRYMILLLCTHLCANALRVNVNAPRHASPNSVTLPTPRLALDQERQPK